MNKYTFALFLSCFLSGLITPEPTYEYLRRCHMNRIHPGNYSAVETNDIEVHKLGETALHILTSVDGDTKRNLSEKTIDDLQLFFYDEKKPEFTIFNTLNDTRTYIGAGTLAGLLISPLDDRDQLEQRQECIKYLVANNDLRETLKEELQEFAWYEKDLLPLWNEQSIIFNKSIQDTFFHGNIAKVTDAYSYARNVYGPDAFGIFTIFASQGFMVYLLSKSGLEEHIPTLWPKKKCSNGADAPDGVLQKKSNALLMLGAVGTLFTFLLGGNSILREHLYRRQVVTTIRKSVRSLDALYAIIKTVYNRMLDHPELALYLPELTHIIALLQTKHSLIEELFTSLSTVGKIGQNNYFTKVGTTLRTISLFLQIRSLLGKALHTIGLLDAYISIANQFCTYENHPRAQYNFATYITNDYPTLTADEIWHPMIHPDIVVTNDVIIGNNATANLLLTGQNEGGKSTIIKSVILTALLAQTTTLAPAKSLAMTPYGVIQTSLSSQENPSLNESRFRAELNNAREIIDTQASEKSFVLTGLDELFSSLKPRDGGNTAYAYTHHMIQNPYGTLILATHFPLLYDLEKNTAGLIHNYHVGVSVEKNGVVRYLYTLERGASISHSALNSLKQEAHGEEMYAIAQSRLDTYKTSGE